MSLESGRARALLESVRPCGDMMLMQLVYAGDEQEGARDIIDDGIQLICRGVVYGDDAAAGALKLGCTLAYTEGILLAEPVTGLNSRRR
ncbi:hypothetical protein TRAPUB_13261 [Trametes pubescens]|uniref:Uncharacterized protein n=1 Tax=Trametes pubescens TaxID=154538 RepID=A0A1M2VRF7_TRAPU|nr:hypothetical protein TRAPUB_13261 [Trametes pubescens]